MAARQVVSLALFELSSLLWITILFAQPPTPSPSPAPTTAPGFSVPLIPDSYMVISDRDLKRMLERDAERLRYIKACYGREKKKRGSKSNQKNNVIPINGEHAMNISVGTPPVQILATIDPLSDHIWTKCRCFNCHLVEKGVPSVPPKPSNYKNISCSIPTTRSIDIKRACTTSKKRQYFVNYVYQSTYSGVIATETITLGFHKFPNVILRCDFGNQGKSGLNIIGLGNGPNSLVSQIDKSIDGKFSYCLVTLFSKGSKSSKINFGRKAVISGHDVVSTQIVSKPPSTFYWLTLKAITIGNVRVSFTAFDGDQKGNVIIDFGTTLFTLPKDFYKKVKAEVEKQVKAKRVNAPHQELSLCYDATSFEAPEIIVNFEGADVKLNYYNVFVKVEEGIVCFALVSSSLGIYGSLAQMNFLVGYDRVAKRVSFKPMDCSRYST